MEKARTQYIMVAMKVTGDTKNEVYSYMLYDKVNNSYFDCILKNIEANINKIENLEIKDGKVVGSCGSISRYALIDNVKGLVDIDGTAAPHRKPIVVLGKDDNGRMVCVDYRGNKLRLAVPDAIRYANKFGIANGKIVTAYGKEYVSSIVGSFPLLEGDTEDIKDRQLETLTGTNVINESCDMKIKKHNNKLIMMSSLFVNKVEIPDSIDLVSSNSVRIMNTQPVEIIIGKECEVMEKFISSMTLPEVELLEYTGYNEQTLLNLLSMLYKCKINRLVINACTLNAKSILYLFRSRFISKIGGSVGKNSILDIISYDNSVVTDEVYKSSVSMVSSLYTRFSTYNGSELTRLKGLDIEDREKNIALLREMINSNSEILSSSIEVLSPLYSDEQEELISSMLLKKILSFWSKYMPQK